MKKIIFGMISKLTSANHIKKSTYTPLTRFHISHRYSSSGFFFFFFKTNIHNIRSGTVENIIFAVIPNVISIMSPEKFISNKLLIAQNFEKHFCTIPKHHISFMMITSLQKMNIAAIMCFASSSRLISFCCTEIPPYCICRDLINLVWIISILPRPLTKSQ